MFSVTTNTRYNAEGNPLVSVQKLLISNLSDTIESKNLTIDERNLTSTQWVEYHVGTKRKSYNTLPTSNITAEAVSVDGFTLSQTDNAGVTTTNTRSYTANGMIHSRTDARGKVKAHTYEPARGLLLGTTYSDSTSPRTYTYNHLGQLTQVTDAAGVRILSYNAYSEQESDSLVADSVTHLITETRDDKGRSTGYTYAKNGSVQQTVTTDYGSDGQIASAGFLYGGAAKQFSYQYLFGTHLLEKLTMPNNMTLTQSYEIQRDLLTGMAYKRGSTLVANRQYSYDTLGRPTARNSSRQGTVKNDTFGYNNRSELTSATVNGSNYAYDYDNIGNRETATESEITTSYTANELNQYTAVGDFTPTFDADGNQTLVKSSTGIWSITYDAENRPVSFTNAESNTVVECAYDHMGRRATKKVTVNGAITLHQRYLYRGYLQIACCDLTRSNHPALWFITWDPTQPIATRPLAIQKDGTWFTYGWDLTKNICELYGSNGYIRTTYSYSPYGLPSQSTNGATAGDVTQPIQWSSEYNDTELGLVYYNYRHYNPMDGRWTGRDRKRTNKELCYNYVDNNSIMISDYLGNDGIPSHLPDRLSRHMYDLYQRNQTPAGTYEDPTPEQISSFPAGRYTGLILDISEIDLGLPFQIWRIIKNRHHILDKVTQQITTELEKTIKGKAKGQYIDSYPTIKSYDFGILNFALGDGIVRTYTEYQYNWCPMNHLNQGILSWHGDILVHYLDVFEKPYKTAGIGLSCESGNPYAYEHKWNANIGMEDITII